MYMGNEGRSNIAGSVLNAAAHQQSQDYVTFLVLGEDLQARLGNRQLDRFRHDMSHNCLTFYATDI